MGILRTRYACGCVRTTTTVGDGVAVAQADGECGHCEPRISHPSPNRRPVGPAPLFGRVFVIRSGYRVWPTRHHG